VATTHTVESTKDTVRSGYLDPTAKPVATIAPGDTVRYPNTWTHWGNEATFGMTFADREPLRRRYPNGPYSMLGPVEVAGAEPGDVVECSITKLRTIGWGWNSFPLGVGALPHDFPEPYVHYFTFDDTRTTAEYTHGIKLAMAPFLGVVGVEPAGDDPVSAILSGAYGGNLVLRDLGVGSHLFLPVAKAGARIWNGDVHALQGDGVVDQTAIGPGKRAGRESGTAPWADPTCSTAPRAPMRVPRRCWTRSARSGPPRGRRPCTSP
jgi:acetamidase/formamidase